MLFSELLLGILFYLVTTCLAFIGFPISKQIFSNNLLSYTIAKALGLVVFGYFIWLLASARILNYQSHALIFVLFTGLFIAGIFISYIIKAKSTSENIKKKEIGRPFWQQALLLEALGLLAFTLYLVLRSHNAGANGTERFMDMAMLSAASKTNYFPFIDPWYAGHTVNYYYYGSYLMSLLSNLARLPVTLTYNFALGLIYSQSLLLSGSLIYALSKSKKMAVVGAVLLTTCGTLFFANCALRTSFFHPITTCSYASSTRLYSPSYIINEIPSYSFTVGDLHAHLLALPFFLLGLLLIYAIMENDKPRLWLAPVLGLSLATSGMINAWDLISLSCLVGLTLLYKLLRAWQNEPKDTKIVTLKHWLQFGFLVLIFTWVLLWPALRSFQNPVLGLGFVPDYVKQHTLTNIQWPTPIKAEIGMWGVLLLGSGFALYRYRKNLHEHAYLLILFLLSFGIIIGVELFFIRDIYSVANPPYFRANTTFKFGYHAWSMLCILFSAGLGRVLTYKGQTSRMTTAFVYTLVAVTLSAGLVYPYAAIAQFYLSSHEPKTLNAAHWMQEQTPEDYATVQYINTHIPNRTVIAEAVGDSYTTFSRMVTYTGNSTPMGWSTHEWTWRFQGKNALHAKPGEQVETGWGAVSKVSGDTRTLYETNNALEALQLLEQYHIEYVYIGQLERTTYKNLNEQKFAELGKVVFSVGNSSLYKVSGAK